MSTDSTPQVRKEDAIAWATGITRLAEIFGLTHSAVCQWQIYVPTARVYELRLKRPDWFRADGTMRRPPARRRAD